MSGSNDALTQFMLMQARQQQRRPSAQAQLAQQMMAQSAQGGPVWGTGATIARAVPGVLGAFMAMRAEGQDRKREDQQLQQMQDRGDKRDYLQTEAFNTAMGRPSAQPPMPPQEAPQMAAPMSGTAPMPPAPQREALPAAMPSMNDDGGVEASTVRYNAMPGRPPVGATYGNQPENRGAMIPDPDRPGQMMQNPWHELRGQLPPANGRINLLPLGGGATPVSAPQGQPAAPSGPPTADMLRQRITALAALGDNPRAVRQLQADERELARLEGERIRREDRQFMLDNREPRQRPAPSEFQRLLADAGIAPNSEEARTLARRRLEGRGAPGEGGAFAGTGMEAQANNILLSIGPRIANGTATPQERDTYALAFGHVERGNVQQIPDPTDPTGQRMVLARIPGSIPEQFPRPAAPQSAPSAAPSGGPSQAAPAPQADAAPQIPGAPQVIPGTSRPGQPPTEDERRNSGFASRMIEAETMMDRQINAGYAPGNIRDSIASRTPLVGNFAVSGRGQQFQNAAEAWVRAKLRRESGAVIGEDEMAREIRTYFPVPGDTPETLAQKRELRAVAVEELRTGAGRAAPPLAQPGASAAPTRTFSYDAQGRRVQQ